MSGGCTVNGALTDDSAVLGGSSGGGGSTTGGGSDGVDDPIRCSSGCDTEAEAETAPAPIRDPFLITQVPVTLADIAAFRPELAVDAMEPEGWAVVGLHTNFFAAGGRSIVEGELLGQSAAVRFTPVGWRWSYGDGASTSSATPGASWASLGIREFEPTATSHAYDRRGTYTVGLEVEYAAEYRFAGANWVAIPGVLALQSDPLSVTVGSARTVLVERECTVDPAGPGC